MKWNLCSTVILFRRRKDSNHPENISGRNYADPMAPGTEAGGKNFEVR
jgi:hypothetical protein